MSLCQQGGDFERVYPAIRRHSKDFPIMSLAI